MGTRADFYVGSGETAKWLGSIGFDGYPTGIDKSIFEIDPERTYQQNEETYRKSVNSFLESVDHGTLPTQGWPWPWPDSHLTDYAYTFVNGKVMCSRFGGEWFAIDLADPSLGDQTTEDAADQYRANCTVQCPLCTYKMHPATIFPNMTQVQNIAQDSRSGLLLIRI